MWRKIIRKFKCLLVKRVECNHRKIQAEYRTNPECNYGEEIAFK